MWNYAKWLPLPVLHYSSPNSFVAETVSEMHVMRSDYYSTATQHRHTSLDSLQEEFYQATADSVRSSSAGHEISVESTYALLENVSSK
jgi:hypothetical protein